MIQIKAGLQTRSTLAITALATAGFMPTTAADAKTPGKTYCFHGHCHTVKTLAETHALVGRTQVVKASFYDDPKRDRFNPSNVNSSGVYFRSDKPDNAASPILPDGTKALVWNPRTKKTLMIRIDNAGPYWGDRTLDLSRAAAEKIGITTGGVGTVHMRVMAAPTKAESTYKLGRTYAPVAGFMGVFADLDAAFTSVGRTLVAGLTPTPAPAPAKAPVAPRVAEAKSADAKRIPEAPKRVIVADAAPKAVVRAPLAPVARIAAAEPERIVAKTTVAQTPRIPVSQMEFLVRAAERKAERVALLVR